MHVTILAEHILAVSLKNFYTAFKAQSLFLRLDFAHVQGPLLRI